MREQYPNPRVFDSWEVCAGRANFRLLYYYSSTKDAKLWRENGSQRDLFFSALDKILGIRQKEQKDLMKTIRAREVMSHPVITISASASVKEAARLMGENKIGCLPVVKDKQFVGLVTETDILRYFAAR